MIIALPVTAVVLFLGSKVLRWSNNNHSEITTYEITLTEKKEKYALLGASASNGLSRETSPRRYYLTGKTKDGQLIKCQVPFNEFDKVKEDRVYLLTMQGERFIKIEKVQADG